MDSTSRPAGVSALDKAVAALTAPDATKSGVYRLRYLGDPVLREVCKPVSDENPIPEGLIEALLHETQRLRGAGLSAPQLGVPIQLAVVMVQDKPRIIINPYDLEVSGTQEPGEEGCLSMPEFFTQVLRYPHFDFCYKDTRGCDHRFTLEGWEARVAQHEIDHLFGRLIVDYVSRQQRRLAERMTQEWLKKNRPSS